METVKIQIVTYNAHIFKGMLIGDKYKDEKRLFAMTQRTLNNPAAYHTAAFDVVAFTEVWSHEMQDQLMGHMHNVNFHGYAYQKEPFPFSSPGMVIGTPHTFGQEKDMRNGNNFRAYQQMICDDAGAYKGVSWAMIIKGGLPIFVVQTHAQATYDYLRALPNPAKWPLSKEEQKIYTVHRELQLRTTLFPVLEALSTSGLPVFLLGDLNIEAGGAEYDAFAANMKVLGFQDGWVDKYGKTGGITYNPATNKLVQKFDDSQTHPQRLDYIFYSTGPGRVQVADMRVPQNWKLADGTDLSDHYPLTGCFEINWSQRDWRRCDKCQGLFFADGRTSHGRCPADDGQHEKKDNTDYALLLYERTDVQAGWLWCHKCQGLFFCNGQVSNGNCPASGQHEGDKSSNYYLLKDGGQRGEDWRWCHKCQGLFFAYGEASRGRCHAGGQHENTNSGAYRISVESCNR